MIIPNINAKAVDVSNEEELRLAIEQGGNIYLTHDIEITRPLVIDKDVNIDGDWNERILMKGDNTLMTVNSGNVSLSADLYAGWNGKGDSVVKNQGKSLVVNGRTVNFRISSLYAGNVGIEVNRGTVTGSPSIYAGETNEPSQIVNVPATSAYASIIIVVLGILCIIVSVIVTRKVTKKNN